MRYGRTPRSLWEVVPLRLRVQGHRLQLLWGQAGRDVAALELHFQDGKNRRLEVVHGFFLYVVPRADYRAGHRPAFLVARRADGKILGKRLLLEFTLAE